MGLRSGFSRPISVNSSLLYLLVIDFFSCSAVLIIIMSRAKCQPAHELLYGLKVMHIDPTNKNVMSVRYHFCVYFGREQAASVQ